MEKTGESRKYFEEALVGDNQMQQLVDDLKIIGINDCFRITEEGIKVCHHDTLGIVLLKGFLCKYKKSGYRLHIIDEKALILETPETLFAGFRLVNQKYKDENMEQGVKVNPGYYAVRLNGYKLAPVMKSDNVVNYNIEKELKKLDINNIKFDFSEVK